MAFNTLYTAFNAQFSIPSCLRILFIHQFFIVILTLKMDCLFASPTWGEAEGINMPVANCALSDALSGRSLCLAKSCALR